MPVFTFGGGHVCPQCERPLGRCYVELPSRDAMVALFGIKWSHEYPSQGAAGVRKFFLQRRTPGACACGETCVCIGCGAKVDCGNLCNECEAD